MRMIFQKRKRLINNIRSYDTYFMKHLKNNLKDYTIRSLTTKDLDAYNALLRYAFQDRNLPKFAGKMTRLSSQSFLFCRELMLWGVLIMIR